MTRAPERYGYWLGTNRLAYGDNRLVKKNTTYRVSGVLEMCFNGLHYSPHPINTLSFKDIEPNSRLWKVQDIGHRRISESNKICTNARKHIISIPAKKAFQTALIEAVIDKTIDEIKFTGGLHLPLRIRRIPTMTELQIENEIKNPIKALMREEINSTTTPSPNRLYALALCLELVLILSKINNNIASFIRYTQLNTPEMREAIKEKIDQMLEKAEKKSKSRAHPPLPRKTKR